jgi:hypothetical protein
MNRIFFTLALTIATWQQSSAAPVQPVFTNDTVANTLSFNDTFGHQVVMGVYDPATGLWTAQGVAGGFTNLTVSGNATIAGTLGVTGLATFNSVTINGTMSGPGVSNYFASPPPIGATAANTGAFTNLSAATLSGAGFNSLIAAPPVGVGSVTPNGGAFTSLSASGTVSGAGFANYLLSPPAIGNAAPNTGAFTTLSASSIGATTPGALFGSTLQIGIPGGANLNGNGTTDNAAVLQTALTAAASGGYIKLPCGKFKVSSAGLSLTLAAGAHLTIEGAGHDCTTVFLSTAAANSGLVVTLTNLNNSVMIRGISFTTDQTTGANTAITLSEAVSNAVPFQLPSVIDDVVIRGDDYAGAGVSDYFGTGINLTNVGVVNIGNVFISGTAAHNVGTGVSLVGHPAATANYAVEFNFVNFTANQLLYGIYQNSYTQGLAIANGNFTGDQFGIYSPAAATGMLDELNIVTSQFNTYGHSIEILNNNYSSINLAANYFLAPGGSTNVHFVDLGNVVRASITGNTFYGAAQTGAAGVVMNGNCVSCAITGNNFSFDAFGVIASSGVNGIATGNTFNSTAANFAGAFTSAFGVYNNNSDAGFVNTSPAGNITGTNAAAGHIGEVIKSNILSGAAVSLSNSVAKDVTTVVLTAGDWDCRGDIAFLGAPTGLTFYGGGINSVLNTLPSQGINGMFYQFYVTGAPGAASAFPVGTFQLNLSAGATYHLVAQSNFSGGTVSAYGNAECRRVQ